MGLRFIYSCVQLTYIGNTHNRHSPKTPLKCPSSRSKNGKEDKKLAELVSPFTRGGRKAGSRELSYQFLRGSMAP